MKITICCPGRFHVGDLARELINLGHDVSFHSIVPPRQLENLGIPRENQVCYLAYVLPLVILQRKFKLPRQLAIQINLRIQKILDNRFSLILDPGDVFIGMSGLCVDSLQAAKSRGAKIIVERGSRHILSQQKILQKLNPELPSPVAESAVQRELQSYVASDFVAVPSRHVQESFLEFDPSVRLFRNPYGTNLDLFGPTCLEKDFFDVIMVGGWSIRKGCNRLAEVVLEQLGLRLLHVGPIIDCPIPTSSNFKHINSVPQNSLPEFYGKAAVFAMPSQEEGLSVVQAQALSCGLPVVGSARSGSEDLAELLELGPEIVQSPDPGNSEAIRDAISEVLKNIDKRNERPRDLIKGKRSKISWSSYGKRYESFLRGLS